MSKAPFVIEGWTIEPTLNCVARNGHSTHLEPKAMQLLVLLAEYSGEVLPREMIINQIWGDAFITDQVLTNAIWQIRHAFGDHGKDLIQTVPKNGYRLSAPAEPPPPELMHDRDAVKAGDIGPGIETPSPGKNNFPTNRLSRISKRVAVLILAVLGFLYLAYLLLKPPVTIAVLPFENVSGDQRQNFAADSFTEQLIQTLSKSHPRKLGVIAWSAVLPYKNSTRPVQEIGKELKARYILEGKVWQNGSLTHVRVELVEVRSQRQVWSGNYEHAADDLNTMQDGIAEEIAGVVLPKAPEMVN